VLAAAREVAKETFKKRMAEIQMDPLDVQVSFIHRVFFITPDAEAASAITYFNSPNFGTPDVSKVHVENRGRGEEAEVHRRHVAGKGQGATVGQTPDTRGP
jgi:hypothetical protein